MDGTVIPQFPGNLDPRAQEFIPRNYISSLPLLSPPLYYPYPSLPPPPPPPPYAPQPHPFSPQPAYFSIPCVSLPPPPMTMPSRALLVSMVPPDVSESTVRRDLEVFGDVRAVQMERVRDGIVTVHFYDMRQARRALIEIQEQNMQQQYRLRRHYDEVAVRSSNFSVNLVTSSSPHGQLPLPPAPPPGPGLIAGLAVWAQFTVPLASSMPDGNNQGTLVIFNLDPEVPSCHLKQIFEAFGHVKELRETPMKKHQRFVEFYDIRDAALAIGEMNGKEIQGKPIVIEYSRPGGQCKKLSKAFRNASRSNLISWNPNNHLARRIIPRSPPPPPSPPPMPQHSPSRLQDKTSNGCKEEPKGDPDRSSSSNSASGNEELSTSRPSPLKKNCMKSSGNFTSNPSTPKPRQQQPRSSGTKLRRGLRQSRECDPRFLIDEDAIMDSNCRDSRTTVMIKNIPNKYSQKLLLNMLDNHCIHCNEQIAEGDDRPLSSYDFVYLPIDFINKCNVGYGFVNMTSPEATWRLYKAFHRQSWEVFNSRKICEVTYARLQGLEALKEHFKNSKFLCDADEYMPVLFSPPRDGRQLTEPVPICGRSSTGPPLPGRSSFSPPASSKDESEDGGISCGDFQEHEGGEK